MKPTYVRFVLSSNKDVKYNIPSSNTINLKVPQAITPGQSNLSAFHLLNGTLPTVAATQARITITSPSSTFNSPKQIIIQKTNNLATVSPNSGAHSNSSLSFAETVATRSNNISMIPTIDIDNMYPSVMQPMIPSSTIKRSCSSSSPTTQQTIKQSKKKKLEEAGTNPGKRRFWTEDETITFVNLWIDYYPKLTAGGSRHAPIYNSMANELNNMLVDRCLTGAEVKIKIGNLTTEYRRKKKDQGRTGASPSPWPYYDLIDKLLGERPYMDDKLLTDSIKIKPEQEQDGENNDVSSAPGLNSTQVSQQVTDVIELTTNYDDVNDPTPVNPTSSPSSSTITSIPKSDGPVQVISKLKKDASLKKKRASETKMDLIKELFGKIENASDAAARSEVKVLELLEKQTRLQEQSMDNEREFLNVFKSIMNNMTANQ